MPTTMIGGRPIDVNDEGFLTDYAQWDEDLGKVLAGYAGVDELTLMPSGTRFWPRVLAVFACAMLTILLAIVIVYAATVFKKEVARTNLSPFGEYSIELPPGEYTIDTGYTGVDTSKDLPHQVTIEPGEITEFNFSIDTGVR